METPICVDTDIFIDALRGKEDALDFFDRAGPLVMTTFTLFELTLGAYKSNNVPIHLAAIEALTQGIDVLTLRPESARVAGSITAHLQKKGKVIGLVDTFIGAIALAEGCPIKTGNHKEFSRIPGLKIV